MNILLWNKLLRTHFVNKHYCYRYLSQSLIDFPDTLPQNIEQQWYSKWEKNEYFIQKQIQNDKIFSMILPPPNVTGVLHLGHALTATIQDILARWHRMQGYSVLWIPGLDHAGIATQVVVEKYLHKTRGICKTDVGRDEFLHILNQWKNEKGSEIRNQLKLLGVSLNWSKEYYTMSKEHNNAVTKAFSLLYDRNLLYRNKTLVNWSPSLQSTISDIEIEPITITEKTLLSIPGYKKKIPFGQIIEIAYKLKDSEDEIVVATTRPETMMGDVALAVHPNDERYTKFIGKQVWHPLQEKFIPVISDTLVDRNFGTGALKITPAHDHLDYAIANTHKLELINVIDESGNMTSAAKLFQGLPRFIAREKMLLKLGEIGALRDIRDHVVTLPKCSRSGDIIEYILKEQWYLKSKDMANRAIQVVKDGSLCIDPPQYNELWCNWLENIRDWCVSRQLWWGHKIPAYYVPLNNNTGEWIVAQSENAAQQIAKKKYDYIGEIYQDNDVLDTWFSSVLLPFTAMGWPNKSKDLCQYYPLSLMETGNDIMHFWVARMVMIGLELTNQLPFKKVLLHGVLCDAQGRKMSKSLGNVISPNQIINGVNLENLNQEAKKRYEMGILDKNELQRTLNINSEMFSDGIPQCGVDALRMSLSSHNIKEYNMSFNIIECRTNKHFLNKIWQATRYILQILDEPQIEEPKSLSIVDKWILSRLALMVIKVNMAFEESNFHRAITAIRDFFHYEFCDFYIEATKWGFKDKNENIMNGHKYTLTKCLEIFLRILSPIAPYTTDEIYTRLSKKLSTFSSISSLIEAPYPKIDEFENYRNESLDAVMNNIINVTLSIRSLTAAANKKLHPHVHIVTNELDSIHYEENINIIKGGSRIWNISVHQIDTYKPTENYILSTTGCNTFLFLYPQDTSSLEKIKLKLEEKKINLEKKIIKLIKLTEKSDYETKVSMNQKLKNVKTIQQLKEEIERLPILVDQDEKSNQLK